MRTILTVLVLCLALPVQAQDRSTVTVRGTGEVAAVPDMATVMLGVVREGDTAAEAMDALAEATDAVLSRVTSEGVDARDVQTGELSLHPRWERRDDDAPPRIRGYVARTMLTVRARDLDGLGALLDAVVSDGANELAGLSFSLQDPAEAEDAARRAAFAQAMARAALYAEAAGMAVGPILSISEGDASAPGPGPMFAMEEARAMPIAPGEVTQAITVTLVVELAPAE